MVYIPISINLDNLIEEFDLGPQQVAKLASDLSTNLTNTFMNALKSKVNNTLRATKNIYLRNLSIEQIDDYNKEIVLKGWLPNAIEEGVSSFDMKPGFSKAKNVKISLEGNWYTTIPFLYSKGNAVSEGKQNLPKPIQEVMKKANLPLQSKDIPESYRLAKIKQIAASLGGGTYQHKSSIYQGLRQNKQDNNSYINFRRVGAKSDAKAFIYPNLEKKDLFGKALNDISSEIPILADNVINNFLENQGF